MNLRNVTTAVVLACALALPSTPALGAPATMRTPFGVSSVSGPSALVQAAKKKPKAVVTATYTTLPNGKVLVKVTSNATKVQVKYRTTKNKKRALNKKLKRGTATLTLPVGSRTITVRAKATSKLATSPWMPATPPAPPAVPAQPAPPAQSAPPVTPPAPPVTPPVVTPPDTAAPGRVTGLQVTAVTPTTITLAWTNPGDTDLDAVIVNRNGAQVVYEGLAGTFTDTGLTPDTDYIYLVYARDTSNNQPAASSWTPINVTTQPLPDTQAPAPVEALRVTATTSASATIEWDYPSPPADLDGFIVRRGQQQLGFVADPSFTEQGLDSATDYEYTVVAIDTSGNESTPAVVSATTQTLVLNDTGWSSWFPETAAGVLNPFDPQVAMSDDGSRAMAVWSGQGGNRVSWWNGTAWDPAEDLAFAQWTGTGVGMSPDGSRASLLGSFGEGPVVHSWQAGSWSSGPSAYEVPSGYHLEYPDAAFSSDAVSVVAIWSEVSDPPYTGTDRVMAAVWDGTAWSTPQALSADVPHFSLPRVAVSADGTRAAAVWTANVGIQASLWDGTSWSSPTTVAAGLPNADARVAMAADGSRAVAIITGLGVTSASLFDGTVWSAPQPLGNASATRTSIAMSNDGSKAVALWVDFSDRQLKSATLTNTTWGPSTAVAESVSMIPKDLVLSPEGTRAVAVWRAGAEVRSANLQQGGWSSAKTLGTASTQSLGLLPSLAVSGSADARTIAATWIYRDSLTNAYLPELAIGKASTP